MRLTNLVPSFLRAPLRLPSVTVGSRVRAAETANSADTPENAKYWRRLGERSSRNLREIDHQKMVGECTHSAQVDGMGRSHVRLVRSITVGAMEIDAQTECKDEAAREKIAEQLRVFWRDPMNAMPRRLGDFMAGLTSTGSLCLTLHTGVVSKLTRIGYVDPAAFVAPGVVTDPGNVLAPLCVLRKASGSVAAVVAHPIVREDLTIAEEFVGMAPGTAVKIPVGERTVDATLGVPCVYAGVNIVAPNQSVGISDLYPALDLMHLLDELVFRSVERSINLGAYSLHVKFPKGTSADDITKRMDAIRADLESGDGRSVGTTDDVSIAAVAAALQAGEWATLEKMARTNALISLGPWPVHIFSEGAGTNVTAAAEQGSPVANFLLERQNDLRRAILLLTTYALRQYPEVAKLLDKHKDARVVLPLPTIVAKNTTRESNVLMVELTALRRLYDDGVITLEGFRREALDASARYGFSLTQADLEDMTKARARIEMQSLSVAPLQPDDDPDADPRGGSREGEKQKVPEGTPRAEAA